MHRIDKDQIEDGYIYFVNFDNLKWRTRVEKTTVEDFNRIVLSTFDQCVDILGSKEKEYAHDGDRLSSFRTAGKIQGEGAIKALGGMMCKHTVSIYDLIDDVEQGLDHPLTMWEEKIHDHINYLLCLKCLVLENNEKTGEDNS